jgi:hypothetical protein
MASNHQKHRPVQTASSFSPSHGAALYLIGLSATNNFVEGLKIRPGTTLLNVAPPMKNVSPVFLEAADKVIQLMVDAGLPEH